MAPISNHVSVSVLLQRILPRPLYNVWRTLRSLGKNRLRERELEFVRALEFVSQNDVEGDILEFGVFEGASLIDLYYTLLRVTRERKKDALPRRILAFDSFEGLSQPSNFDTHGFDTGMFSCSLDQVRRNLRNARIDPTAITFIPGWYDQILTPTLRDELAIKRAAVINLDCDLYEPTRVVLDWCDPFIGQGTVLIFDDWFCNQGKSDSGVRRAFQEFLDQRPNLRPEEFGKYFWHGKLFLMHESVETANTIV